MNHYATFGYQLQITTALHLPTEPVLAGASLGVQQGLVTLPDGVPIHDALDQPKGDRLRIWSGQRQAWIAYGQIKAALQPNTISVQGEITEPLIERVLLPIHRMFVLKDAVGFHGSAVCDDEGAFVFIGPSRAGKSSTAHALIQMGWRLVGDDVVLIDTNGNVLPAPPAVRLLSDPSQPDKRRLDLPFESGQVQPTPMLGVVPLIRDGVTQSLNGTHALQTLLAASFTVTNPTPDWNQARFRRISELTRQFPVRAFGVPTSEDATPTHAHNLSEWLRTW